MVAESITTDPVLEVLSGAALVTVNAPADDADVEGAATLAAAEVVIPLPEDVSPLVASELAALAEPVTEAVAAVVAAVIEVTTDPIETTGSLPATPISHADTSEPLDLETSIIE